MRLRSSFLYALVQSSWCSEFAFRFILRGQSQGYTVIRPNLFALLAWNKEVWVISSMELVSIWRRCFYFSGRKEPPRKCLFCTRFSFFTLCFLSSFLQSLRESFFKPLQNFFVSIRVNRRRNIFVVHIKPGATRLWSALFTPPIP